MSSQSLSHSVTIWILEMLAHLKREIPLHLSGPFRPYLKTHSGEKLNNEQIPLHLSGPKCLSASERHLLSLIGQLIFHSVQCALGTIGLKNWVNFRKTSKGRGGHFRSKKFLCRFECSKRGLNFRKKGGSLVSEKFRCRFSYLPKKSAT